METLGYDLSSYQGNLSSDVFSAIAAEGKFVVIQVNYGTPDNPQVLNIDSNFALARSLAQASGTVHGLYHFSYPALNSASDEADFFVSTIGDLSEGEFIALDFEEPIKNADGSLSSDNASWAYSWLSFVESQTGVKPLIYMDQNLYLNIDWTEVANAGYPLWIAGYTNDPSNLGSFPMKYWSFVSMGQYSDKGTMPVNGDIIDLDVFYGPLDNLRKLGKQIVMTTTTTNQTTTTVSDPVSSTTTPTIVIPDTSSTDSVSTAPEAGGAVTANEPSSSGSVEKVATSTEGVKPNFIQVIDQDLKSLEKVILDLEKGLLPSSSTIRDLKNWIVDLFTKRG